MTAVRGMLANWPAHSATLSGRSSPLVSPEEDSAMFAPASRRAFLKSAAGAAAVASLPQLDFLGQLPRVSAQDAQPDPKTVQLSPEIEPLVRLVEDTPRGELLEAVAAKIKSGTTYREVLAALLLAGVRNIQPRPS